jgi:hypothetical protein
MKSRLRAKSLLCRHHRQLLLHLALASGCLVLLIGSAGCRGNSLFPAPGPLNKQQASAVVHDPYPARDIGPYDAGSRPPGYDQPLPEPVRNRIYKDSFPSWTGN